MVITTGTVLFGGLALIAGGLFGAQAGKMLADSITNIGKEIKSNNAQNKEIARELESEKSHNQRTKDLQERQANGENTKEITKKFEDISNFAKDLANALIESQKPKPITVTEQSAAAEKEETPNQEQQINPIPSISDKIPNISDKTEENTEIQVNGIANNFEYALKWAEEQQQKQWEREDAIRKETQEREDTAYSRAIQDLKNAGVNPNLFNVSPAESAGGITQATGLNMTLYQEEMKKYISEFETIMNNDVKADENSKDRLLEVVSKFITMAGMVGLMKK